MSYVGGNGRLGAVPVAAAAVVTQKLFPNLFASSTKDQNPLRAQMNTDLANRALTGDTAALQQLEVRSQPGALPYDMWKDAAAKLATVKSQLGNRIQSGGSVTSTGTTLFATPGGQSTGQQASLLPGIAGAGGLILLAILLRGRI